MANRRDFLKGASLLSLGALAACNAKGNAPAAAPAAAAAVAGSKTLGLQIYTLGQELYQGNLADNFKKIAGMGIKHIELAGYDASDSKIGGVEMMEFKKTVEDAGMKIVSSHVNPPALFAGAAGREDRSGNAGKFNSAMKNTIVESFKKIADDHAKLGCKYVIQPMMPMSGIETIDSAKAFADILNATGEVCKAAGVQFGYHNHDMEFVPVTEKYSEPYLPTVLHRKQGQAIMDIFMDNTAPENCCFELDVYWTVMGKNDPVAWMQKRADRIKMLHIKDFMVLGQSGAMNFQKIFEQFYANGMQYFFIEIEDITSGKQFERLQASADFLNGSSFVK